ncbi:MAG: 3-dehydroquinate synthase [Roseovarius sp.]|nr:3-dehydroquinate synthase [Roseovarius sp.]
MQELVHVGLAERAYDVLIGPGLLHGAGELVSPILMRPKIWIVTDDNVATLHLETLRQGLEKKGIETASLILPPGESTKSWKQLQICVEWLLEKKVERRDVVVALGGGVIGDLAGFASAILRRGVRYVQVPTSLLAQVDSSVGGKTGINSPSGKNLIGSFYQPSMVLADTDVLNSLSRRDFLAGYGEVLKYGLLGDDEFFGWLEDNGPKMVSGDISTRIRAVRRSVEMKAQIVQSDEKERDGRALLNLGHTFCHAMEAATGYSERLLHGEGVAIGCVLAFNLSVRMGLCSEEDLFRVKTHMGNMNIKSRLSDIEGDLPGAHAFLDLMAQDKKVVDGRLRFVLARRIGDAFVTDQVDPGLVVEMLSGELGH